MKNLEELMDNYAELSVSVGINLQPGQTLLIHADIESAAFVRRVVRQAYAAGAKHVYVEWNDDQLQLAKFTFESEEALAEFPTWKAEEYNGLAKEGGAMLAIVSSDPDALRDANPGRVAIYHTAVAEATKEFTNHQMSGRLRWSGIAVPSPRWAAKVFPGLPQDVAIDRLWDTIFKINRVNQADPIAAWNTHVGALADKCATLDARSYHKLHYRAPGTALTIELPGDHVWFGGARENMDGIRSVPNMPTEEVFTLPKRDGVHGTVRATKPLIHGGSIVENFFFVFQDGRIVDFGAERGYDVLKEILDVDEGARYLGEVALVPVDSPISRSNLLFYRTLYDENASCHLALGQAYPCFRNAESMSDEDFVAAGANASLVHVDFMIGSPELDIDGEFADGSTEPLFRNGNWVS